MSEPMLSDELRAKLEAGLVPEEMEEMLANPEFASWLSSIQGDFDPRARVASTSRLREIVQIAKRRDLNRQLPEGKLDELRPKGRHILIPIQEHVFAQGVPTEPHFRVQARLAMRDGTVEEGILDIDQRVWAKLKPVGPERRHRADPDWQQVLSTLADLVDQLPRHIGALQNAETGQDMLSDDPSWTKTFFPDRVRSLAPYWVTAETQTLIEVASESMPKDAPLRLDDLVTPTGFAMFERIIHIDSDRGLLPVRAISWFVAPVRYRGGKSQPGLMLTGWLDTDAAREADIQVPEPASGYRARVFPSIMTTWFEGESAQALQNEEGWGQGPYITLREFTHAFWLLAAQRVTLVSGRKPARGFRREAARAKLPVSEVVVVTLRRAADKTYEDSGDPQHVEWSHRWVVSGHWRHWWSETEHRMKVTWISPYVKGPEDKPLVVKDRVYRFSR